MKKCLYFCCSLLVLCLMAVPGASAADISVRDEFAAHFAGFTGTFVMYDPAGDKYIVYNEPQKQKTVVPCSTFKIYNSLIGLEPAYWTRKMYTRCSNGTGRNTLSPTGTTIAPPWHRPPGSRWCGTSGARRAHRPGTDAGIYR